MTIKKVYRALNESRNRPWRHLSNREQESILKELKELGIVYIDRGDYLEIEGQECWDERDIEEMVDYLF